MTLFLKKCILLGALLLFAAGGSGLFAEEQEPEDAPFVPATVTHILGDQAISFSLGGFVPLFFIRLADGGVELTNMVFGGKGSIQYLTYLSTNWILSFELALALAFTPNFNIYWLVPLTAKISYVFYINPFQLYLTMGLGVDFQSFLGYSCVDLIARPEIGFYFPIDPTMELGISVSYWFNPQFSSAEQEANKTGQSRIGNFLDVSASLIYHF